MTNQINLHFKLFGDFLYMAEGDDQWHSLDELPDTSIGKKQRAFLIYLLLNHHRKITSVELMEHFWSEDGKSPANSLKNTLHKTRALLRSMFPMCEDLILTQTGGYIWSSDVSIQLDTEQFESLYRASKTLPTSERIVQEHEAFSLYNGDILAGASVDWLDHLNTYYRSVFIDLCKSLVLLLQEDERLDDVIRICRHVYPMSPETEEFTVCFMRALVSAGTPALAIKHYEEYQAMLRQEFDLAPSEQVDEIYALALDFNSKTTTFSEELIRQLTQLPDTPKAFQCSLLVFRNLVQLELRSMMRNNQSSSIVLINISKSENKHFSTDIRRLERTLLYRLRTADPFTRLNLNAIALLLPGSSEENSHTVMERITHSFYATYPKSKVQLQYRVFPLSCER